VWSVARVSVVPITSPDNTIGEQFPREKATIGLSLYGGRIDVKIFTSKAILFIDFRADAIYMVST